MSILLEYFNSDFSSNNGMSINRPWPTNIPDIIIQERINVFNDTSIRMLLYYIPNIKNTLEIIKSLIEYIKNNPIDVLGLTSVARISGEVYVGDYSNLYSNRIYFYVENDLTEYNTPQKLDSKYKQKTNKFAV